MASSFVEVAEEIGRTIAAPASDDVDRAGRFPSETFAALRDSQLLGLLVPDKWGGPEASLEIVSASIAALARSCGSSALILAMHYIQVASIINHAQNQAKDELLPQIADGALLVASANSEEGRAGERRASTCALVQDGSDFVLEKQAATLSYGQQADVILASARSHPEAEAHDQVVAICVAPQTELQITGTWDSMGMRGTCSPPATLRARIPSHLIIRDDIFLSTALPLSSTLLASVWLGLAEEAAARAHRSVRARARKARQTSGQTTPPTSALRLAELTVPLYQLRESVAAGVRDYEHNRDESLDFAARMDTLKVSASQLVMDVTHRAMNICGLSGYLNDSPDSVARLVRDASSAPLMVNNDRSLMGTAHTLLARKDI